MKSSTTLILLGLLCVVLFVSSVHVAAEESHDAETNAHDEGEFEAAAYGGKGYGYGGKGGGYGHGGKGGGYGYGHGGKGGGYRGGCKHGCCGHSYGGGCKCCMNAEEAKVYNLHG